MTSFLPSPPLVERSPEVFFARVELPFCFAGEEPPALSFEADASCRADLIIAIV